MRERERERESLFERETESTSAATPFRVYVASRANIVINIINIITPPRETSTSTAAHSRPRNSMYYRNGGEIPAKPSPPTSFMLVPLAFTSQ